MLGKPSLGLEDCTGEAKQGHFPPLLAQFSSQGKRKQKFLLLKGVAMVISAPCQYWRNTFINCALFCFSANSQLEIIISKVNVKMLLSLLPFYLVFEVPITAQNLFCFLQGDAASVGGNEQTNCDDCSLVLMLLCLENTLEVGPVAKTR